MIKNLNQTMNTNQSLIEELLKKVCINLNSELENIVPNYPVGCCYLFGHVLAVGLSNIGLTAIEVTGSLILADKHHNKVVYGSRKYKGKDVGYYHTWCELKWNNDTIIIDPSLKYNRVFLKQHFGIKLEKKTPDIIISKESNTSFYNYLTDSSLSYLSKNNLKHVNPGLIETLTKLVSKTTSDLLNQISLTSLSNEISLIKLA